MFVAVATVIAREHLLNMFVAVATVIASEYLLNMFVAVVIASELLL